MRASGILMPIFSLPSRHGIGAMGKEAYRFVDFLERSGQRYWQILPLNPTGFGNSPYNSFSAFAGNPFFIDLDLLIECGLLSESEVMTAYFGSDALRVDYDALEQNRMPLLRKAFARFAANREYETFCLDNAYWLEDYTRFMVMKDHFGDCSFTAWSIARGSKEEEAFFLSAEAQRELSFYRFVQFLFYTQWFALKKYANEKGISIIGDIPIYVSFDSADVWANRDQFLLDDSYHPRAVAGVPPDAFSADGQVWGNPLYDWARMETEGFSWWVARFRAAFKVYDVVRVDHFRAFDEYFAVPAGDTNARNGGWMPGPGMRLFDCIRQALGDNLPIIAEDLGLITDSVRNLLKKTGFPGMSVLQFAFDPGYESDYLPHNISKNSVVYTGTHDNDTVMGWLAHESKKNTDFAKRYLHFSEREGFNWTMMRAAMMSHADTCILCMQDLLGLSSEGRVNTPSTVGSNWRWRIEGSCINDWLAGILREFTALYSRLGD